MNRILIWVLAVVLLVGCVHFSAEELLPTPKSTFQSTSMESTLTPTAVPTVTLMPSPPPTFEPTETPIPVCLEGWKRFEGRGIDFCLPNSWEGGSDEKLGEVIAELKTKGPSGNQMASSVESISNQLLFWGYDTELHPVVTNMNIGTDKASMSVSQYMDAGCQQVSDYYKQFGGIAACTETSVVTVGNYEGVGKLVLEESINGVQMKAVQYTIESGGYFWMVTFTAGSLQYPGYQSIFETAASTLNIH